MKQNTTLEKTRANQFSKFQNLLIGGKNSIFAKIDCFVNFLSQILTLKSTLYY